MLHAVFSLLKALALTNHSDEFISNVPAIAEDFLLSKTLMDSRSVVYSNKNTICVRISEKMVGLTFLSSFK